MKTAKFMLILTLSVTMTSYVPIADVYAATNTHSEDQIIAADKLLKQNKETQSANIVKNDNVQAISKTYNDWFPDDVLAAEVAREFGDTSDELVSEGDLASLKQLFCHGLGIQDSTGIEYLTGLEELVISRNQLTTLDISKNTNLAILDCGSNLLTNIDISKNLELDEFKCNDNQLTNLDVSKNIALYLLYLDNNQLTDLDVSKNLNLGGIYCRNNQLTNLDVSKNPKLSTLQCEDNQLTSLDLSKNPKLMWLECENNQLANLDVSNNPEVLNIYCYNNQLTNLGLSSNVNLQTFFCSDNQLTNLDVSKNLKLSTIDCFNNQLKDISSIPDNIANYSATNQLILEPLQVIDANKLVYAIPTNLFDKNGDELSIIVPKNGGVYDAASKTITWDNLTESGEVEYTFSSIDNEFTGTVSVPHQTRALTSDDEISYIEGTTRTEAAFLTDIHASISPVSETIKSNFTDVVDLTTPGKYQVTLRVTNSSITKEVTVYVTAKPNDDTPINPLVPDKQPYDDILPVDKPDDDERSDEEQVSPANVPVKITEQETPTKAGKVAVNTKSLPKTGDNSSSGWTVAGYIFFGFSLFYLIKRKKNKLNG
ncbi:LPXTG cell wall anchor domain-containing protein [Listeria ivanovii]|uniref:LPXTG cell wall anchor domain-containing protein n=1 Tax=Listeria ivanovii TaxID=1638 RepID=UPI00065E396F|nr:LPXTG cell wall anchor domain-containing protein [Listeria ivanovii]